MPPRVAPGYLNGKVGSKKKMTVVVFYLDPNNTTNKFQIGSNEVMELNPHKRKVINHIRKWTDRNCKVH